MHAHRQAASTHAKYCGVVQAGTAAIGMDVAAATHASAGEIAARQRERLTQLLHAAQRTRYYGKLLGHRDPGLIELTTLPAAGKPQLMAHFDDFVCDPALTLAGLQTFCADPQHIATRYLGRYWIWESSGSTGQPGVFVQTDAAMAVYDALEATRRASPRPWVRLFDPLYLAERIAFVGATSGHFASYVSLQRLRAANPLLASAWQSFSIMQPVEALVAQLNAFSPSIVATYPTAAVLLAQQLQLGHLRVRPQEIWTGGEHLSAAMRSCIEQAFGCALRNSYGASEFLPIAWECSHGQLHVNADWVILEAVDAQHRPVAAGRASHTTLLTNLANHVQPLIRFDIGDRIVLPTTPCACGCALPVVQVQGRRDDSITAPAPHGKSITLLPLALTTVLEDHAGVFDFQLCQQGLKTWQLDLGPGVPRTRAARDRCRDALMQYAAAQGAVGLQITTRSVTAIPLGNTGKIKRVVAAKNVRRTQCD
jgi:phenylacetate-CoA ligase